MGVDLKVHLGVFITKAASVTAWDPAIFFLLSSRTHIIFLANDLATVYLMSCFTILTLIVSMGEAISFWILHGRDTIDPRTMLQSSRAVWLICKICFAKVSRESGEREGAHGSPWKPMAYAVPLQRQGSLETIKVCCFLVESQHGLLFALGCLPDHSHSCRLHAVWARLCSTKADAITRRKNNVELRKIRANIFYSRRMAVCRWKNLDILDQPPYPNSSWVKDGYSTGSRTRQGSWAELSPWPQVWPSQN
jgi:hypothetical protein